MVADDGGDDEGDGGVEPVVAVGGVDDPAGHGYSCGCGGVGSGVE